MTEEETTARAQGTQGTGDEWADSPKHELRFRETPSHVNDIARRVIEAAAQVHRHLGPGYAESVYENALAVELGLRGLPPSRDRRVSASTTRDARSARVEWTSSSRASSSWSSRLSIASPRSTSHKPSLT